ncbi:hypothetical protein [Fictibacillus nanhaiensis]|uniref:hypothetical protein n=1 Tax=Fictibacillus nanhaiensis TaxID=742169 RepID=UPI003C1582EF
MALDEFYGDEDDEGNEYTVDSRGNVQIDLDERREYYKVEAEQEKIRDMLTHSEEETNETVKS